MPRPPVRRQVRTAAILLLARGHSLREVARRFGLWHTTIRKLVRPPSVIVSSKRPRRCRGCGGLVTKWPCVLCRARAHGKLQRSQHPRPEDEAFASSIARAHQEHQEEPAVELRGEHRRRYEKLRAGKRPGERPYSGQEQEEKYHGLRLVRSS